MRTCLVEQGKNLEISIQKAKIYATCTLSFQFFLQGIRYSIKCLVENSSYFNLPWSCITLNLSNIRDPSILFSSASLILSIDIEPCFMISKHSCRISSFSSSENKNTFPLPVQVLGATDAVSMEKSSCSMFGLSGNKRFTLLYYIFCLSVYAFQINLNKPVSHLWRICIS